MRNEEMLIKAPSDELYVRQPNWIFKMSLAAKYRELLQRLKNLIFEFEELSSKIKEFLRICQWEKSDLSTIDALVARKKELQRLLILKSQLTRIKNGQ